MSRRSALALAPAIVAVLAFSGAHAAPLSFFEADSFAVGSAPTAMALAQLDGAAGPDLAVVRADGSLTLLRNDGVGHFGAQSTLLGSAAATVAAADVNGDGVPDLACSRTAPNRITLLSGSGGGAFGSPVDVAMPASVAELRLVDLTGDGAPELLVRHATTGGLTVWLNDGHAHFTLSATLLSGMQVLGFDVARVDGDASLDLVATADYFKLRIFRGNGDATFQAPDALPDVAWPVFGLRAADLNGDAQPDLVRLSTEGTPRFDIAFGDGASGFGAWQQVDVPGLTTQSSGAKLVADVDGDGDMDLLVVQRNDSYTGTGGVMFPMLNDGHGSFMPGLRYAFEPKGYGIVPREVALADLDSDGVADLLVRSAALSGTDRGGFARLMGSSAGRFRATQWTRFDFDPPYGSWDLRSVRLVAGGPPDLLSWLPPSPGFPVSSTLRFPNRGDGTFGDGGELLPAQALVGTADADHDGVEERLVSWDGSLVRAWLNDGAAHLSLAGSTAATNEPLGIGDLDGDGLPDLFLRDVSGQVAVCPGLPDGSFGPPLATGVPYPAGPGAARVPLVTDLQGDGLADLVYVTGQLCPFTLVLHVWRGASGFAFGAPESLAVPVIVPPPPGPGLCGDYGSQPARLLAGDVDGDGRTDLLLLRSGGTDGAYGGLQAFLATPGGAYVPGPQAVGTGGTGLAMADFDRDGYTDAGVARSDGNGGDRVFLFHGVSPPAFAFESLLFLPNMPAGIAAADFDGDGMPDLATVSPHSRVVCVFRNALPPSLPTPVLASLADARALAGRIEIEWRLEGARAAIVTIERTTDGIAWSAVTSASPDAGGLVSYRDVDVAAGGTYGYRLAWTEQGRRVVAATTFLTVPVLGRIALRALGLARESARFELVAPAAGEATLALFDVAGRQVAASRVRVDGAGSQRVSIGRDLAPGLYLARASMGNAYALARVAVIR